MSRFKKWAEREYSMRQRIVVLFFEGILFVAAIPFFLVMASYYVDEWFNFPRFVRGTMNFIAAMPFIIAGLLFAIWAIGVQFSLGQDRL